MQTDLFQVNLSQSQKSALLRRAALLTAKTGKRHTMSDLIRAALDQALNTPIEDTAGDAKTKAVKFTPTPAVEKALQQAHFNSGKPVSEIINESLAEAFQMEVTSL